tara:strand:- start:17482 stop:17745 length:264 start_codon:yes stop_codon:yes gene_type:complete
MEPQAEIDNLAAEIYRDKVLRAREQDPCEKFLDGFRLFESALAFTEAGVASELGTQDPNAIQLAVQARFDRVRMVRERGIYEPMESK